jgi:hypothetical protein
MEKEDINEIYGKDNIYNEKIIFYSGGFSPIIEFYIDEDGNIDNWTLEDHSIVWQWCIDNKDKFNTKKKYKRFLKTDDWGTKESREYYKKIIDYYIKHYLNK